MTNKEVLTSCLLRGFSFCSYTIMATEKAFVKLNRFRPLVRHSIVYAYLNLLSSPSTSNITSSIFSWGNPGDTRIIRIPRTIQFNVDEEGNVGPNMIIRNSTGYPSWDNEVKKALARWKFKPAQVSRRIATITFHFYLK
ncbi:MAG: energy transducer TonB [candidate division WOR-3 bacterium]|nr:energy transducer TonB [candidate division WOR-3 bacterium]